MAALAPTLNYSVYLGAHDDVTPVDCSDQEHFMARTIIGVNDARRQSGGLGFLARPVSQVLFLASGFMWAELRVPKCPPRSWTDRNDAGEQISTTCWPS